MIWLLLLSVAVVALGLWHLLFPMSIMKFTDWIGRADKYSQPNPDWKPGYLLPSRVFGLLLVAMGSIVLYAALAAMMGVGDKVAPKSLPSQESAPQWLTLLFGVLFTIGGIKAMVRPGSFARNFSRQEAHRKLSEKALRSLTLIERVTGALLAAAGVAAIIISLRPTY